MSTYLDEDLVTQKYKSIQILRGIAALMVVFYHCLTLWNERISAALGVYPNGAAGVTFSLSLAALL
jgi:peptidoglycan/LPS O-acetylase OafA/YrhL